MVERITSRQNPLLVHVRKLISSRSYREKHGHFVGDGVKLLKEAVRWYDGLETVIMTAGAVDFPIPDHVRTVEVPKDVMESVSAMDAPQGAIFVCRSPEPKPLAFDAGTLILDGIQDPGNVGTILRTADALDIPVVLSSGCADAYNPKTVRASMGAVLRNTPTVASRDDIIAYCAAHSIPLYSTALSDRALDLRSAKVHGAIVIGSEGKGVCSEFLQASAQEIIIPMNPRCESLNAAIAAAIVMWELKYR